MRKVTALLLSLCLMLGLMTPAFAAQPKTAADTGSRGPASAFASKETKAKDFMEQYLQEKNTYQYGDNEIVRAIVILEGAPVTETPYSVASAQAEAYAAQLRTEQAAVYQAMRASGVEFTLEHTFDTLLNGFSCDVAYGELDTIANLPGVVSVHIANVYSIPTPQEPNMGVANQMTGNALNNGKGGEGIVVAVLDSGVHYDHEAFQNYGQLGEAKLTRNDVADAGVPGHYISAKVPYGYDYADQDTDPDDDGEGTEGHGSHVAGIAVGYAENDEGAVTFCGAAPQAQLLAMKIFKTKASTTNSDIYLKALEDALKLGADVINMSIGSDSGFTHDDELDEMEENIYEKLENAGVVVCISAGNSDSMGEYSTKGYISTDYADYGVVGSPSTYANNISVASLENMAYPQQFIWVGDENISFMDSSDDGLWVKRFGGKEVEYVLLADAKDNLLLGYPEDFEEVYKLTADTDLAVVNPFEGKIVVLSRGGNTFSEKVENAYDAGAMGVIVVNNQPGAISMAIDKFFIPAVSVQLSAKDVLMKARDKTVYTDAEFHLAPSTTGGEMSSFSSWGTTPDLRMKPVLTSVGGNIWSVNAWTEDEYTLMSGTSMASPNLAGTFAVVLSKLYAAYENDPYMDKVAIAEEAKYIMESSAELIYDPDGLLYSVRKQGLGLGRSDWAMDAWAAGYVQNSINELGANEDGVYTFPIALHNNSNHDITYTTSAVVMTDTADDGEVTFQPTYLYDDMTDEGAHVNGAVVTMPDSVTVPAGESVSVDVTVELNAAGKKYINDNFENGSFVEGYIQFTPVSLNWANYLAGVPVHAGFLGFYGDWGKAPALEAYDWTEYLDVEDWLNTDPMGQFYAEEYGATPDMFLDVTTDVNWAYLAYPYGDDNYYISALGNNRFNSWVEDPADWVSYNPAHNMLSANEDAWYNLLLIQPYLLRNAQEIKYTVSNAETGEIYFTDAEQYRPKARYVTSSNGSFWYSFADSLWDGYNGDEIVPDGTEVTVSVDVTLADEDSTVQEGLWSFNFTMDSTAPELLSATYTAPAAGEENGTLTLEIEEANLQMICLVVDGYAYDFKLFDTYEGDTQTVVFDIPSWWTEYGIYNTVGIRMMDYATNVTDDVALLQEDIGAPATVTLVSPRGTTAIDAAIGDYVTLPGCADATTLGDNAEFVFWCDYKVEPVYSNAEFYETYGYGSVHYAGTELLVTGDATFYAVYQAGTRVPLDPPHYVGDLAVDNYTGDWAITGLPVDDEYYYVFDDLFVLAKDGRGYRLNDLDPAVEYDEDYIEFASSADSIRFTFAMLDDGSYTIRNAANGQYLAMNENAALTMVSSASDDSAKWEVAAYTASNGLTFTVIQNVTDSELVLSLNQDEAPYMMMQSMTDIYVDQCPMLYQYTDSELVDTCYTGQLEAPSSGTTTPSTPAEPTRPTTPSRPGSGTTTPPVVTKPGDDQIPTPPVPPVVPMVTVNDDGSTTTTVTDTAAGITTITVAKPDGSAVEKIVNSEGNVSIVVTDPTGEVLVRIVLPAEVPTPDSRFSDVPEGHWADEAVQSMVALGLITGKGDNKFDLDSPMTRSGLAMMLFRLANGKAGCTQDFGDVDPNAWYADAVAWAAMTGVVTGNNGDFMPDGEITREQLATMLFRFAKLLNLDVTASANGLNGFPDGGEVSAWAADAMAWCIANGIIQGNGEGNLAPDGTATRAQVAVIFQRFINLIK